MQWHVLTKLLNIIITIKDEVEDNVEIESINTTIVEGMSSIYTERMGVESSIQQESESISSAYTMGGKKPRKRQRKKKSAKQKIRQGGNN